MSLIKYTLKLKDKDDLEEHASDVGLTVHSVCGWYTRDSAGDYCEDKNFVKYLNIPNNFEVNYDLNKSNEGDVYKPQCTRGETITNLLQWISIHCINDEGKPKRPEADFAAYRGLLRMIMCTPYERSESWMVCAVRLKGTIYLCQYPTEENKKEMERQQTEEMKKFTRYGYKFEQYLLSDHPGEEPDLDQPLSEYEEMNCMFRGSVGEHELLYGAEMDGLPDEGSLNDLSSVKFAELKTNKINPAEYSFTRFKLLKWWAQCILARVSYVLVGYRDDEGIVRKLEKFEVADIPSRAKGRWEPKQCMTFLNDFLNFIKHTMREGPDDDPTAVYQFEWYPTRNENTVTGRRLPSNNPYKFIPQFYMDYLNS